MGTRQRAVEFIRAGLLTHELRNRIRARRGQPRILRPDARRTIGDYYSARRMNRLAGELGDVTTYLEVGVARGFTLEAVKAPTRTGVDPRPQFSLQHLPAGLSVFVGTSDDFFATLDPDETFDLVFLDGLHTYQQTYRDLIHSLHHTTPAGVIMIDDVVPIDDVSAMSDQQESYAERQRRGLAGTQWQGDVFRMITLVRDHHPELEIRTIVGTGNAQTVVWKASADSNSTAVSDEIVASYLNVSYQDVFSGGIPESFNPATEDDVIAAAVRSVRHNVAEGAGRRP